jgi:hypothetical protein
MTLANDLSMNDASERFKRTELRKRTTPNGSFSIRPVCMWLEVMVVMDALRSDVKRVSLAVDPMEVAVEEEVLSFWCVIRESTRWPHFVTRSMCEQSRVAMGWEKPRTVKRVTLSW